MFAKVELLLRPMASRTIAPTVSAPNNPAMVSRMGNCCSTDRLPMNGNLKPLLFFVGLVPLAAATSALIFRVWVPVALPALVVGPVPVDALNLFFLLPNSLAKKDLGVVPLEAALVGALDVATVFLVSLFVRDGILSAMGFSVTCLI